MKENVGDLSECGNLWNAVDVAVIPSLSARKINLPLRPRLLATPSLRHV